MESNSTGMVLFFIVRAMGHHGTDWFSRTLSLRHTPTGKVLVEIRAQRFALLPLLLLGTAFSVLSPLFWTHVESRGSDSGVGGHENVELFGRVVPTLQYGFDRAKAGEWPLWASDLYCGVPFFANPTHGMLQPLNLVFLFVPVSIGLALHAFLGLLLMGMGTALFLRALGAGYLAALMGGMAFAFGGASAVSMSRPELLGVLAWTPLLYWVIYEHTEAPRPFHIVVGALLLAIMVFAGTPLLALCLGASALAYGMARSLWLRKEGERTLRRRLAYLLAMAGLAAGFSAVQWVPHVAWLLTLANPQEALWPGTWAGVAPALASELPAALLLPGNGMFPDMLYIGVISLTVIPAALLRQQARFEVAFFAVAAILWIGGAIGRGDGTSASEAWKILVFPGVFSLAVLVGLGADRVLLTGRDPRSPLIWGSSVLMLLAASATLLLGPPEARGWVLGAVAVLLPFFLLRVKYVGLVCGGLLALLLFADLRDASNNVYQHPYTDKGAWLQDSLPALREAEALALGERILTLPPARAMTLPPNIGLLLGIPNAYGAYWPLSTGQAAWWESLDASLNPARRQEIAAPPEGTLPHSALLNYMGVRLFLGERPLPWMDSPADQSGVSLQFLRTLGRLSLWRNNSAYPRVRVVPQWHPVADERAARDLLLSPSFPGAFACAVEASGSGWRHLNETLPPTVETDVADPDWDATCVLRSDEPESVVVDVDTPGDGVLVLADTYTPGWRVYVDGERADLLKVNGMFRGVQLGAGTHEVQFVYAPISVSLGLLLTGLAVVLTLATGVRSLIQTVGKSLRAPRTERDTEGEGLE